MITISNIDKNNYNIIRKNVSDFIKTISQNYDNENFIVLDIAPEKHLGVKEFFKFSKIKTLDIDINSNADYIADICQKNDNIIPNNTFDIIFCTEVLEHTNNPFKAVEELERILKPNGLICISTPFNFRIHGPLPDNWRFTIHGLRTLFSNFNDVQINELNDSERDLMPIHYTLQARKKYDI
jgi:SAM-dependent methyltransferase